MLNLWYIHDITGHIRSLRGRCCLGFGDDHHKVAVLQRFARLDYAIAQSFPVPERFQTIIIHGDHQEKTRAVHLASLDPLGGPLVLFHEAVLALKRQLPEQTGLFIGPQPLLCITRVLADERGKIHPKFTSRFGRYYEFQAHP